MLSTSRWVSWVSKLSRRSLGAQCCHFVTAARRTRGAVTERSSGSPSLVIMTTGMPVTEHLSKKFDAELESIRSRVLEMGGLVESQIRRAVEGLQSANLALLDDV